MFGNVIKNAQYREQPAPPPDVSLAIHMPQLMSPSYPVQDSPTKRKPKMVPESKVKVVKGDYYEIITATVITKVRVEKIWQNEEDGNTYVVISQNFPQGRKTHAMSIQEFKQRLIIGGVAEVQI